MTEDETRGLRYIEKSIFRNLITWNLSFRIYLNKNMGMPGDGGKNTFDTMYRKFDI